MSRLRKRWSEDEILAAGAAVGIFLIGFALLHVWFWAHGQISDVGEYEQYGTAIVHHGQVPYRDFAVDYPPGALPVFIVPEIFGGYATAFEWLMVALGVMTIAVVERVRPRAAWFVAFSPLLIGSQLLTRFDLWPTLLATAAIAALVLEFDVAGWALLGAAVAAKGWPLVLVPLALAWSWRRGHRLAPLAGLVSLAAFVVPFAVVAPHGLWNSVHEQASRPLQIESLGAAFITTFGHPHVIDSHGSQNLSGEGAVAAALVALAAASLVALWIAYARGEQSPARLVRYAAATTCAFVAFDKVLSPQFLIWLVPLVALVPRRRGVVAVALLSAALILTQVWFPSRYWDYAMHFHLAGVVLARDLLLVALLGVLALPLRNLDA